WFAYHISVSVPARSTVSWKENPTPSFASTKRRLRQLPCWTSLSVSFKSLKLMTFMRVLSRRVVRGLVGGMDGSSTTGVEHDIDRTRYSADTARGLRCATSSIGTAESRRYAAWG